MKITMMMKERRRVRKVSGDIDYGGDVVDEKEKFE